MANQLVGAEKWRTSIALASKITVPISCRLEPESTDGARKLAAIVQPNFFLRALQSAAAEALIGPTGLLNSEYQKRANAQEKYYPRWRYGSDGGLPRETPGEKWGHTERRAPDQVKHILNYSGGGFQQLWSAISTTAGSTTSEGARLRIGPGEVVNRLKLGNYMQMRGTPSRRSPYDSLFYATEFGTGIAENVGGEQWVRGFGPTKVTSTAPDDRGAWWFGNFRGHGMLMTGQRGFHFLYDERTRKPKDIYRYRLLQALPDAIRKELQAFGGDGIKLRH